MHIQIDRSILIIYSLNIFLLVSLELVHGRCSWRFHHYLHPFDCGAVDSSDSPNFQNVEMCKPKYKPNSHGRLSPLGLVPIFRSGTFWLLFHYCQCEKRQHLKICIFALVAVNYLKISKSIRNIIQYLWQIVLILKFLLKVVFLMT